MLMIEWKKQNKKYRMKISRPKKPKILKINAQWTRAKFYFYNFVVVVTLTKTQIRSQIYERICISAVQRIAMF